MTFLRTTLPLALTMALLASGARAGVDAAQAERLKQDLTPFGAERAGNADGSIPPWEGGYTTPLPDPRTDPFAADKPLYQINAQNMGEYATQLSEGTRALLQKYPDSFHLDVYPTRRTASAPQWVYDNTYANATRGQLEGDDVRGAFGGVPFPIPQSGTEVMWNHLLRWQGVALQRSPSQYQATANGKLVKITDITSDYQYPFYYQDGSPETFYDSGEFSKLRLLTRAPAIRAGDAIVGIENLDQDKTQVWLYLTGQRRVRKLPNPCCDTPDPSTGGITSVDEAYGFFGRLDRYDWKLVGKQEMFIPYNNNRIFGAATDEDVMAPHHVKPAYMRWEKHRVWVIDATLRAGKRHQAPRSRYYCDEDTWICTLGERWDGHGQLWKMTWVAPVVAPDMPALLPAVFGAHDLLAETAFISGINSRASANPPFVIRERQPDSVFTPDAMAGEGIR